MSASERHQLRPVLGLHAGKVEQLAALGDVERVQPVYGDDVAPAGIDLPRGRRGVSTG